MSHFTVLVIGDDPEKQLAPFQENNMGDCPKEYLEFNDVTEESLKEYNEGDNEMIKSPSGELFYTWDDQFKVKDPTDPFRNNTVIPVGYERITIKHNEKYKTFAEYMEDYCDREKDQETGKYGYWENPNAKWDWYQLGGRWTGFFKLQKRFGQVFNVFNVGEPGLMTEEAKEGYADQLAKKDIDFVGMRREAAIKAGETYDFAMNVIGHLPVNESWESIRERIENRDEARDLFWNQPRCKEWTQASRKDRENWPFGFDASPDDFIISREKYIQNARDKAICTFAVVKDGKWYERGEMGWWATIANENTNWEAEFSKLLDSVSDDTLISVYDCHI